MSTYENVEIPDLAQMVVLSPPPSEFVCFDKRRDHQWTLVLPQNKGSYPPATEVLVRLFWECAICSWRNEAQVKS